MRVQRWPVAMAATVVLVVGGWWLLRPVGSGPGTEPPADWVATRRLREERTGYGPMAAYQPLATKTMSGGNSPSPASANELPLSTLAAMREKGDLLGMSALYAAYGQGELALATLKGQPNTVEVDAQRGMAHLVARQPAEALRMLDSVLERSPRHAQALWNRALALQELRLTMLAAVAFDEVARLGEPGWADEARTRAERLRGEGRGRFDGWKDTCGHGEKLVAGDAVEPSSLGRGTPVNRLYFYDAVRSATSDAQLEHLRKVAADLDAAAPGSRLVGYVDEVRRALPRRRPLAQQYAKLRAGRLSADEARRLLAELQAQPFPDLLVGAIIHASGPLSEGTRAYLPVLRRAADATREPWFRMLAEEELARDALAEGNPSEAVSLLRSAARNCPSDAVTYRCLGVTLELSKAYAALGQLDEAWQTAQRGWAEARSQREWAKELELIQVLAQLAQYRNDFAMARAFLEESVAHAFGDKRVERRAREHLAALELFRLRFDKARGELDRALDTGLPPTLSGAFFLADLARVKGHARDAAALEAALPRRGSDLPEGQRAFAQHILGRFTLAQPGGRAEGRRLLEAALRDAGAILARRPEEPYAKRARAYSYTSLILDDGQARDFAQALARFAEELGAPVPERCALAITEDGDRTLLVMRDADGRLEGQYQEKRTSRLGKSLKGVVPESFVAALGRCAEVEVLARAPLRGRSGLLPEGMAWHYRSRGGPPPAPPTGIPGRYLVVANVDLAQGETLNYWKPAFDGDDQRAPSSRQVLLSGARATPSAVLREMQDATEVDIATHGSVDAADDASALLLAPGAEGDRLTSAAIERSALRGAPLIILAACRGGQPAPVLHEAQSLPGAFIRAGARSVIAATEEITDLEASRFFARVRTRVRAGATPAVAVRDERLEWLRQGTAPGWMQSLVVFQ
jgi:hypothetical protein